MRTAFPAGRVRRPWIVVVVVALLSTGAAGGCGSSDSSTPASTGSSNGAAPNATVAPPKSTRPAAASYDPKIVPADFSTRIDNPCLPDSAHCHNFASSRQLLWDRLGAWAEGVGS